MNIRAKFLQGYLRPARKEMTFAALLVLSACGLSGTQPVGYQSQIRVAEQFLHNGQFGQGYRILDGVSVSLAALPEAQIAIGDAYVRTNALLRAEQAYFKAGQLGATKQASLGSGKIALARNEADNAQLHFRSVLTEDPDNIEARNGMGVAFDIGGAHHLAQAEYRKVLDIQPAHLKAINNLGLSMVLSGNADGGATVLTKLTASKLDDRTVRQNLAISLAISGRQTEAMSLTSLDMSEQQAEKLFSAVKSYRQLKN
jgi:Flp pilus assembly protein TadD